METSRASRGAQSGRASAPRPQARLSWLRSRLLSTWRAAATRSPRTTTQRTGCGRRTRRRGSTGSGFAVDPCAMRSTPTPAARWWRS
eukprot:3579863-Alexandrium_andersonii.AAC.1